MLKEEFRGAKEQIEDGIIPATAVPWTPDYELDRDSLHEHISNLAGVDGIVGLMANAHTGECKMLSREMKQEVVRAHKEAAGDTPVFSGVYGESSLEAVEMAQEAVEAGADGIMLLPLDVYAHGDPREPVEHFRRVAEAVDVPLIDFQFPTWGSPGLPVSAHVEICEMPEVIAFKEASFDPIYCEKVTRALNHLGDDFTMMTGNDTFLFHSYHLGAETGLIGYANLVPDLHVEKVQAVNRGDIDRAREIRQELLELTNFVFGDPAGRYRARTKVALRMQGVFEHDTILPPQQQISMEEQEELRELLREVGRLEQPL